MSLSQPDASPGKYGRRAIPRDDHDLGNPIVIVIGSAALVAVLLYLLHDRQYRANSTKDWLKTRGRILKSSNQYWPGSEYQSELFVPDVTYEYDVGGRLHRSRRSAGRGGRVYLQEISFAFEHEVYEFLEQFPQGKIVDVYYSPRDPGESVLIRGSPRGKGWRYWLSYTLAGFLATILPIGTAIAGFYMFRWLARAARRAKQL